MSHAHYEVRGRTAVIRMDNPPVNGMSYALRSGIVACLDRALADPAVQAVVLMGANADFSGGADIRELGTPKSAMEPNLPTVIAALEDSPKPVIAAITGSCLGGGLELALGAHYRVARADAQIGLPEVKLGLIPGAGGTQRLPRVLGLEPALNMIVSGRPVAAAKLAGTPLLDTVVEDDVLGAALALAERAATDKAPLTRVRDRKVRHDHAEAYLQFARNMVGAMPREFPAPLKCVEAVAASVTQPFAQGLQTEREIFMGLMASPASRALRHVFAAERAATKIPGLSADVQARPIAQVGVIGAGTMGGGITMNYLNAGIPVVLLETKPEALERGLATIRRNYENSLKKGKLTQDDLDARMARITPTLNYDDLREADLIIEAVFEDMDVKEQVFRQLDAVAKPGAILASNTSALDLNRIASFTARPQDVIGLHFFSPANVMRLLEVVRGDKTADDVLLTAMQMAKRIGKIAVVSGVCEGFIGNRMLGRYGAAAGDLVNQGALPQQIDGALQAFGLKMGPYRMGDLAGLDIGWAGRKRRAAANPQAYQRVVADALCEAGRFGQKTGAGWYRYEAGKRDPIPDPEVQKIIEAFRQEKGLPAREISDTEIVERCIFALVNEGARILEEGIAARASDIDVVYLNGYGFPLHRGGPMHYANQVGLPNVVRALQRFARAPGADAAAWTPAPLLVRLAEAGESFQ